MRISSVGKVNQANPYTKLNGSNTRPSLRPRQESNVSLTTKSGERTGVHENIASADLQNPSDALDILAQVAHTADDGDSPPSDHQTPNQARHHQPRSIESLHNPLPTNPECYFHYKPVQDGMINPEMIYHLFSRQAFDCDDVEFLVNE